VYIKVYSLFLGLYVCVFMFHNFIHSKDIHPRIKSFICRFLCFFFLLLTRVTISLVLIPLCFTFMGFFKDFFRFFYCRLVKRDFKWSTFKWKC
jgi:hypothetical protein